MNTYLIECLPVNGIPNGIRKVEEKNENSTSNIEEKGPELLEEIDESDYDDDYDINVFIENDSNEPLQDDLIKNAINFPSMSMNTIKEFTNHAMCALTFPKLFPGMDPLTQLLSQD
ncbi:ATP-dependent DNA helicase PIF1 [Brachionus plicatilis]|uniref:ATP-dependent DNA helicase PIF1 n=1 Tax=Brachionus plicatilis TaxID=10195 RepID=A0A3M7P5Q6_BRAPC|nr:ATP-dependent DNA helicase PIF1 [Brachionus plicatilis]